MKTEADRLWQQGMTQHKAGRFQAAIDSWQQVLTLYREIGDSPNGDSFAALRQHQKAIEYFDQSLAVDQEICTIFF